jgi:hypothetical protein
VAGGWRFGKLTPLLTYGTFNSRQSIIYKDESYGTWSASLRYDVVRNAALKVELSRAQAANPSYWIDPNPTSRQRVNGDYELRLFGSSGRREDDAFQLKAELRLNEVDGRWLTDNAPKVSQEEILTRALVYDFRAGCHIRSVGEKPAACAIRTTQSMIQPSI